MLRIRRKLAKDVFSQIVRPPYYTETQKQGGTAVDTD